MAASTFAPTFTRLPAEPDNPKLFFDQHVGMRPRHPVSVRWIANSPESTNISFEDYARCSTATHKLFAGRKAPIPAWALSDTLLRERLVWIMEKRASYRYPQNGNFEEHFERVRKKNVSLRERYIAILDRLCQEYVGLKIVGGEPQKLRRLEIEIENLDSTLVLMDHFAEVFAAIIYRYYRLGENSVQIATALKMKPQRFAK